MAFQFNNLFKILLAHIHRVDLILVNFMNNEMDFDIHRNELIIFRYKTALTDKLPWNELIKVRIFCEGHKILQNLHLQYIQTKVRWRFRKFVWPSENI